MLTPRVWLPGVRGGDLLSMRARGTKLIPVVWGERLGLQFMYIKVVVMLKVQFIKECEEACFKRKWRRKQRRHVESVMVGDVAGELLPARGGTALRDCGLWVGCPHRRTNTGNAARPWPADSSCWNRGAVRNREPWGKIGGSKYWQKEIIITQQSQPPPLCAAKKRNAKARGEERRDVGLSWAWGRVSWRSVPLEFNRVSIEGEKTKTIRI